LVESFCKSLPQAVSVFAPHGVWGFNIWTLNWGSVGAIILHTNDFIMSIKFQ
jgi:hypothetical protein